MTDFKDKDQQDQQRSFKEQILAELEKANQIRKEKEEELFKKSWKLKKQLGERPSYMLNIKDKMLFKRVYST